MKKFIATIIALSVIAGTLIFASCGTAAGSGWNYDWFDTEYGFNKAIIGLPDGTHMEIDVAQWRDFEDGEQIQIKDKDGNVYLASSFNCVLIKEVG